MLTTTVPIYEKDPDATLVAYLHEEDPEAPVGPRRAVIVCPGGAYEILCPREGEPVALAFLSAGFQAFVLNYSIGDRAAGYAPAIEATRSVRYLREHAAEWNIDPDHILILGFSAGGHVAGSAGVLWKSPEVLAALGIPPGDSNGDPTDTFAQSREMTGENRPPERMGRPDGMILCYPVLSAEPWGHLHSVYRCLGRFPDASGEGPSQADMDRFSLEKQADGDTCPAFLWHCWNDPCVSVRNVLAMADSLLSHGVSCEMHLFREGDHGISLGTPETCGDPHGAGFPDVEAWLPLALTWAKHLP